MNNNQLFQTTRWRLAAWYAGTMGLIWGVCSFGLYEAIVHAHHVTIHREIESIAQTFKQNLTINLKKAGLGETTMDALFSQVCVRDRDCRLAQQNILESVENGLSDDYYVEIFTAEQKSLGASTTKPQNLSLNSRQGAWEYFKDEQNNRYHQILIKLETSNNQTSGYVIIGRNLKDFDRYLHTTAWFLIIGFPLALVLIGVSAWYLSGLAIQPIYASYLQIQQFTGDAAHELRTPLATVRATIESLLMMATWEEEEIKKSFLSIEKQNERMSLLVNDLLILSRIDQSITNNLPQGVKHPVILNDVMDDLEEEFAALALKKNVSLKLKKNVDFPVAIEGNETQIYRLCANVVINALQYSLPQGTVTIRLSVEHRRAIIDITDTGIGIPKNEQTKVFERFYRVNSHRSRHTGGSGLGLAIAKAIVQLHHGSIHVTSELHQGSTFTIQLPYGP